MFLCGDYEFLCRCHDLSGASGKISVSNSILFHMFISGCHCCLYCLTTSDELHLQPPIENLDLRTIDSILHDHRRFMQCGGDRRKAKEFNNVIHEPFFKSIPLSQVILNLFVCHIVYLNLKVCPGASHYFGNIFEALCSDGRRVSHS